MSRYIDADELHNQGWVAARYINWEPTPLNDNFRLEVEVKPFITFTAADVAEVKHGRWVKDEFGSRCGACGLYAYRDKFDKPWESPYCPNCGALLRGDEE